MSLGSAGIASLVTANGILGSAGSGAVVSTLVEKGVEGAISGFIGGSIDACKEQNKQSNKQIQMKNEREDHKNLKYTYNGNEYDPFEEYNDFKDFEDFKNNRGKYSKPYY